MTHHLKCYPVPFVAILDGRKRYEIRKADRPFSAGDLLILCEWGGPTAEGAYTGRYIEAEVTYLTPPGMFGLPSDLCVMSLEIRSIGRGVPSP